MRGRSSQEWGLVGGGGLCFNLSYGIAEHVQDGKDKVDAGDGEGEDPL